MSFLLSRGRVVSSPAALECSVVAKAYASTICRLLHFSIGMWIPRKIRIMTMRYKESTALSSFNWQQRAGSHAVLLQ